MISDGKARKLVWVINGPNLNLLGSREPEIYGHETEEDIIAMLKARARRLALELEYRQSSHEGQLIDWLHEAWKQGAKAVVLNAGGLTHSSVALRDSVAAISTPVIEVHLSNTDSREGFRRRSLIAPVAAGTIKGFGAQSYLLALDAAALL